MAMRFFWSMLAAVLAALFGMAGRASGQSVEGFTEPFRKIELAPAEAGVIDRMLVREGDTVKKNQQVATLDQDVLTVSLQIAKFNVDAKGRLGSATADRDLRRIRFEKLSALRSQGHASQEEVDRARAEFEQAAANLLVVTEQLAVDGMECKKIEAMIERRIVRSPIDGVVIKVHREEKEYVSAASATAAAVATIAQLDPLRIVFSLPTAQSATLRTGQTVNLRFVDGGTAAQGEIEFIAPLTEAESGTVRVKVLLKNPDNAYRCGVRCALDLGTPVTPDK